MYVVNLKGTMDDIIDNCRNKKNALVGSNNKMEYFCALGVDWTHGRVVSTWLPFLLSSPISKVPTY